MHIAKLKYLRKQFPEENCIGGIANTSIAHFIVGTPCMALINPFSKCESPKPGFLLDRMKSSRALFGEPAVKKQIINDVTKAIDLYDMDLDKANEILNYSLNQMKILFLNNVGVGTSDTYVATAKTSGFYFDGSKPLIYDDNHLRVESDDICDILSPEDVENMDGLILNNLKNYRYINYTINNLVRSNTDGLTNVLSRMMKVLSNGLPHNVCFYASDGHMSYILDTLSISFYRLADVISIFDSDKAIGTCVEVFMYASSSKKGAEFSGSYMTMRFLFSKYRDNAFTIDGEEIKRSSDFSTSEGITHMFKIIKQNVGNDVDIRNEQKTASR